MSAIGLFVVDAWSTTQTRQMIRAENRDAITAVKAISLRNKAVFFRTVKDRDAAFAHLPKRFKEKTPGYPLVCLWKGRFPTWATVEQGNHVAQKRSGSEVSSRPRATRPRTRC